MCITRIICRFLFVSCLLGKKPGQVSTRFFPITRLKLVDPVIRGLRSQTDWSQVLEPANSPEPEEAINIGTGVCVPADVFGTAWAAHTHGANRDGILYSGTVVSWEEKHDSFAVGGFNASEDVEYILDRELTRAAITAWVDNGEPDAGLVLHRRDEACDEDEDEGMDDAEVSADLEEILADEDLGAVRGYNNPPGLSDWFKDMEPDVQLDTLLRCSHDLWTWVDNSCHLDTWAVCELFALGRRPLRLTGGILDDDEMGITTFFHSVVISHSSHTVQGDCGICCRRYRTVSQATSTQTGIASGSNLT